MGRERQRARVSERELGRVEERVCGGWCHVSGYTPGCCLSRTQSANVLSHICLPLDPLISLSDGDWFLFPVQELSPFCRFHPQIQIPEYSLRSCSGRVARLSWLQTGRKSRQCAVSNVHLAMTSSSTGAVSMCCARGAAAQIYSAQLVAAEEKTRFRCISWPPCLGGVT